MNLYPLRSAPLTQDDLDARRSFERSLETESGWVALAQSIKNQPDLQVAKIDCRNLFKKWYRNDAQIQDELMAKLEKYLA